MTHGNDTHMERRQGQSHRHSRGRAILLAALMGLIGCVSSTETWRLIGSTKYQEFKAPPPDEQRYNQPPSLADLPRRRDWFPSKPQDYRDMSPAGPNTPPFGRPSPAGAIR
jgi:hypothetical protein